MLGDSLLMPRLLRYSSSSYQSLRENKPHSFAQHHALNIYASDAVYSFIPKNACSTMRTSLAIANGAIRDSSDFNWIHQNNHTFTASLSELAKAKYTFTLLRCPFARLVSVYFDKFLDRNPVAWKYVDLHNRTIELEDITFEFFVKSLAKERIRNGDIHWMPQTSFLVYEHYDDYFALEEFSTATDVLREKIGLEVTDARPLTRHGRDGHKKLNKRKPYTLSPFELLVAKKSGAIPTLKAMYSEELVKVVKRAYKQDIALYKKEIGTKHLSF
ncbi:MAG: sulfotransferase family 2 domain-containing protein [Halioglobus sp.]